MLPQRSASTPQVDSKTLWGDFWFSWDWRGTLAINSLRTKDAKHLQFWGQSRTIKNCPIPNHCAETLTKVAGTLGTKEELPPPPGPRNGALVGMGYIMEEIRCYPIRRLPEMWISTWAWGVISNTYGSALIALQLCFVLLGRRPGEGLVERQRNKLLNTTLRKGGWQQYSKRASRCHLRTMSRAMLGNVTARYTPKTSQFLSEFLRLVILSMKFKLIPDPKTRSVSGFPKGVKPFYHSEVECLGEKWFISPGQLSLPPDLQVLKIQNCQGQLVLRLCRSVV